ncbi:hypothetical protein LIER_14959 [Lithospermum erythrorhizon]|uniref:MADS-box domain-containing protein n=1 Tax=Lithospermum erythrorhizon TaxID=34254 RepID=A0AAV3Q6A8_LITER
MVRRKVEIKKIEDKAKRHTTFTKRRQGLFKKANDLCTKCGADVAIITFSLAGNVYGFGNPSVDSIVRRYQNTEVVEDTTPVIQDNEEEMDVEEEEDDDDEKAEDEEEEEVDGGEELEVLDQLEEAVEDMRKKVSDIAKRMIDKI